MKKANCIALTPEQISAFNMVTDILVESLQSKQLNDETAGGCYELLVTMQDFIKGYCVARETRAN